MHLVIVVFVVDVVTHANEFSIIVAAGEEDDGYAKDFRGGDSFEVRGVGFEDEFVDSNRDGADKEGIEFLVVLGSEISS